MSQRATLAPLGHTWAVGRYNRGYTGRDYHVTGGHETEALAAERAKQPSRVGMWLLRRFGYKGPVAPPVGVPRRGRHGRPHQPR